MDRSAAAAARGRSHLWLANAPAGTYYRSPYFSAHARTRPLNTVLSGQHLSRMGQARRSDTRGCLVILCCNVSGPVASIARLAFSEEAVHGQIVGQMRGRLGSGRGRDPDNARQCFVASIGHDREHRRFRGASVRRVECFYRVAARRSTEFGRSRGETREPGKPF
jgi:hypothetical protein